MHSTMIHTVLYTLLLTINNFKLYITDFQDFYTLMGEFCTMVMEIFKDQQTCVVRQSAILDHLVQAVQL